MKNASLKPRQISPVERLVLWPMSVALRAGLMLPLYGLVSVGKIAQKGFDFLDDSLPGYSPEQIGPKNNA